MLNAVDPLPFRPLLRAAAQQLAHATSADSRRRGSRILLLAAGTFLVLAGAPEAGGLTDWAASIDELANEAAGAAVAALPFGIAVFGLMVMFQVQLFLSTAFSIMAGLAIMAAMIDLPDALFGAAATGGRLGQLLALAAVG